MKIRELIKRLQKIEKEQGDVFVECRNYNGGFRDCVDVIFKEYSDGKFCKIEAKL